MTDANHSAGSVRSLDPDWIVQDVPLEGRAGARRSGQASRGLRDMPAFLSATGTLIPIRQVVAESAATPRRDILGRAGSLRLAMRGGAGEPLIAVARHESGAITLHLPDPTGALAPEAKRRGAARREDAAVFSIPILPGDDLAPTLDGRPERRGIVSKVIKTVVFKAASVLARPVILSLANRLEQRLWHGAGRTEGWVQVSKDALLANRTLPPAVLNPTSGQRSLLLIHGTFSHTASAFRDLAHSDFFAAVSPLYGNRIYGYDHFTISKSPRQNVADLLASLPDGHTQSFDVVTHSRGGLVLRTLARDGDRRLRIGRAVLVAAPNQGTPLATPRRWEDSLAWFANLLEILPDNPFTTAAEWVAESMSWMAQGLTSFLPGLNSMDADGEVIAGLDDDALTADSRCYALVSNYSAPKALALRLLDMGADKFFNGANDLVVPTEGGWKLGPHGERALPADRIACFGPGGNVRGTAKSCVDHISFFQQPEAQAFLRKALAGEPIDLIPIESGGALPRRRIGEQLVESVEPAIQVREEVTMAAATATAPNSATAARAPLPPTDGWTNEDALHLIVLPPNGSNATHSQAAQLLAIYGSARALAPFRLGGEGSEVGGRWHDIIEFHHDIVTYVQGVSEEPPTLERIETGGAVMFDVLFGGEVRRLYDQARFRHQNRRLNVVFTSMIPWVADLPWEFAYDRSCKAFLATSDVRFVRNVLTPVPADNIAAKSGPLRILLVSALPGRATPLSLDEERALVLRSFQPLIEIGAVQVDPLPQATPEALHAWVRQRDYDVIHFMGHGEFDEGTQTGFLIFVDAQRQPQKVPTGCIKDILRGRGVRLVFLNACETGRGARADYNKGVAPGLVSDGVPAVVANQYSVLDRFATTFSQQFYWCLAQGLSLGDAMRESRIALNYSGGGPIDWAVPVLFARNPNARLCEASVRVDVPQMLPRTSTSERRATAHHRHQIDVWDVADSFPELDEALAQMNGAQSVFGFRRVHLTAPYGTWRVDSSKEDGVAYLPVERAIRRLRDNLGTLDAQYLLCVTDLPLRSREWSALYAWWDDAGFPLILLSTWGFEPPLRGSAFHRALANIVVEALASMRSRDNVKSGPKGSVFYFNEERDVDQISGHLRIDSTNAKVLRGELAPDEVDALEVFLRLFHPAGARDDVLSAPPGRKRRA